MPKSYYAAVQLAIRVERGGTLTNILASKVRGGGQR